MKEGVTYVNDNKLYKEIYQIILKEPEVNFEDTEKKESKKEEEKEEQENYKKILTLVEDGHLPDLMNFANGSLNENKVYNNIIYYDENIDFLSSIIEDSMQSLKSLLFSKKFIIFSHLLPVVIKLNLVFLSFLICLIISFFTKSNDSISVHKIKAPEVSLSK